MREKQLVLLGPQRKRKNDLLKLINRLLEPQKGCGTSYRSRPTVEWDPIALRRGIGYVIQEGGLFPHFTVARKYRASYPRLKSGTQRRISYRVHELLELVGLEPKQFADPPP